MRKISEMTVIQIDVTNLCDKSCANCTRFCGHYTPDRLYFMDLDYYEKAVISLKSFKGMIGMIGGEPTLHPRFPEMCEILNFHIKEKERKGLWTNTGKKFQENKRLITDTFGYLNCNDHVTHDIVHAPILVASGDMLKDGRLTEDEWRKYTDSCWVQTSWSATVTPKGAFFCEVAGMLDYLFEGDAGWDITERPEWWRKDIDQYADQIARACRQCGCQLPLRPRKSSDGIDDVSESNLQRLLAVNSPKVKSGRYEIFRQGLDHQQIRNESWYFKRKKNARAVIKKILTAFFR